MRSILLSPLVVLTLFAFAAPAIAEDGVVEINQACAVSTGCFAGDTAGFPVTITGAAGRSYKLTSDLRIAGSDSSAVAISKSFVRLDMNGFLISCTIFVPPASVEPCSESLGSSEDGYAIDAFPVVGVEVRDGAVLGMRGIAVRVGEGSIVRNMRIHDSGESAIVAGQGSLVAGNVAYRNGAHGVSTPGLADNNVAIFNEGYGVLNGSYRGNHLKFNALGGALGHNSGGNYCNGMNVTSPDCP